MRCAATSFSDRRFAGTRPTKSVTQLACLPCHTVGWLSRLRPRASAGTTCNGFASGPTAGKILGKPMITRSDPSTIPSDEVLCAHHRHCIVLRARRAGSHAFGGSTSGAAEEAPRALRRGAPSRGEAPPASSPPIVEGGTPFACGVSLLVSTSFACPSVLPNLIDHT